MRARATAQSHRRGRLAGRGRASRGIIAPLTAMLMSFMILLVLGAAQLGSLIVRRNEVRGAAEAMASLQAERLKIIAAPDNGAKGSDTMMAGNNAGNDQVTLRTFNQFPTSATDDGPSGGPVLRDYSLAPTSYAQVTGQVRSFTPLLPMPLTVRAEARAVIQQFEWRKFIPVRTRFVLVLDYSSSMLKKWETGGVQIDDSGVDVVKQAASIILQATDTQHLKPNFRDRTNFGLVFFSDQTDYTKMPKLDLVEGPNRPDQDVKINELENNRAQGVDLIRTTNASGVSSNTSGGIRAAIAMLDAHTQKANAQSGTDSTQWLGRGTIMLISDGVPNFDPSNPGDQTLSGLENRQVLAKSDTCMAVTGTKYNAGSGTCERGAAQADSAWGKGYQTFSLAIQTDLGRQLADPVDQQKTNAFMASVAGNADKNFTPAAAFALVAPDPESLKNTLGNINPATHCIGSYLLGASLPANEWMRPPVARPDRDVARRLREDIWGFHAPYATWSSRESAVVRLASSADGAMDGAPPSDSRDWSTAADRMRFAYTPHPGFIDDGVVELNVAFCLAYLAATRGGADPQAGPRFRLRWGPHRMVTSQMVD